MKLVIIGLIFIVAICQARVLRGNGGPGDVCDQGGGVKGRCELMTNCQRTSGVFRRNDNIVMCKETNGQQYACCRRPFDIAKEVCKAWKSYWRDNEDKCVAQIPTIVGGQNAKVGQFPEVAILGIVKSSQRTEWKCGATLISPTYVLTAAHCVLDLDPYIMKFGEHDLFEDEENIEPRVVGPVTPGLAGENQLHFENRISVQVEQYGHEGTVIIHPDYDGRYNDIALIKLKNPVVLTKRTLPACLPTDPDEDYFPHNLTVTGWGVEQFGTTVFSSTLQYVTIPVIPRLTCLETVQKLNQFLIPKGIPQELICAGDLGKDSCQGDSGGPLIYPSQVRRENSDLCEHTIVGIVSFGPGCGRIGVYTRVTSYLDWILSYVAPGVVPPKRASTPVPAPASLTDRRPITFPG